MIELTETQLALQHILAEQFKLHPSMHDGTIKRNYPCPYCAVRDELATYVEACRRTARIEEAERRGDTERVRGLAGLIK